MRKQENLYKHWKECFVPPHPSNNFQAQKYYQEKPRFKGVYSKIVYLVYQVIYYKPWQLHKSKNFKLDLPS